MFLKFSKREIAHLSLPRLRTCVNVTMRPFGYFTIWPSEQLMSEIPELIFPNPSTNLVITYVNSVVSVCVEVDCRKQPTYCIRLYFVHFLIANLFMILVVFISHRRSCSVLLRIRLFSMFWLMVLLGSFYNLKTQRRVSKCKKMGWAEVIQYRIVYFQRYLIVCATL